MEDGNCRQSQKDNIIPLSHNYDTQLPGKRYDNNYVNGNSDGLYKFPKKLLPNHDTFPTGDKLKFTDGFHDTKLKNTHKSENNLFVDPKNSIGGLKKTLVKHTPKVNNFKSGLKIATDNSLKTNENGNHKYLDGLPPEKFLKDPNFLNNRKLALRHLHRQQALKKKYLQRIGKYNASYQNEYAQYLGLQPTVKFKCSKCCCTSFESLGMLKEHQRDCSSQVSLESAAEPEPSAAASVSPGNKTNFRITRKVYLCSACGTYYENWNLFLHIREVHNRHICLFCLGMFSQAHKLASHLVVKHNIQECEFSSKEEFFSKYSDSFYLMCCKCENVFTERENFILHECTPAIKQCSVCKSRGGHRSDCPKNSKHKLVTVVNPQTDSKKIKKVASEKKCSDRSNLSNNVLAKNLQINNGCPSNFDSEIQQDHPKTSSVNDKAEAKEYKDNLSPEPLVSDSEINSLNLAAADLVDDNSVEQERPTEIPSIESLPVLPIPECSVSSVGVSDNILLNSDNCINMESQISFQPESPLSSLSDFQGTAQGDKSSTIDKVPRHVRHDTDSLKTVLKPPPRNRRPPKRYQFKDNHVNHNQFNPPVEYLPDVRDTSVEVVNKVPKLTVKVPKMFIDKESTSDYSSESDSDKLTVDFETNADVEADVHSPNDKVDTDCDSVVNTGDCISVNNISKIVNSNVDPEAPVAGDDVPLTELTLDRPLDPYPLKNLLKVFLSATMYNCIYCNHAHKIAVNGKQLGLHFIAQHRFSATVDSITAEELLPETIVLKIKSCLQDVQSVFLNMNGYDSVDKVDMKYYDHTYECFQCYFITTVHKELYLHNRKMHQKTILLCIMCKSNFYSYSELLCHLCPGTYVLNSEIQFRCCLCQLDSIPSAFRLMVHLRKRHHACDVCLETCHNQSKLSNHVWKHKLHHLCYRCGIAYRNKPDITKHLYWKHGTQSVLCKKCLQKKWPHVYHFCIPPNSFVCEECNLTFTRAVCLKVHKRLHTGDRPYLCQELDCSEGFISKRLLAKHVTIHSEPPVPSEPIANVTDVIDVDEEKVHALPATSESEPAILAKLEPKVTPLKVKKSKKSKKNDKDNLLIDVNLPELNLSESDSSNESESEMAKSKIEILDSEIKLDQHVDSAVEDFKPEPPVMGIWDNFKMYQAEIGNKESTYMIPRHVCESDHDYCVIPVSEVSDVKDFEGDKSDDKPLENKMNSSKERKKVKSKKKSIKKEGGSSSSESSSDSDSSCSCGTNCSCSSSSGSSSSSSSSSDSELSSPAVRRDGNAHHKDSDASHTSAVDIMATEESPQLLVPESAEIPIAESDLDTEETETDEDFYDEHPQRLANKIIAEKRNQLMLLATVAPANNGDRSDTGCPSAQEEPEKRVKKKVKTKKKKKDKRNEISLESPTNINFLNPKINIPEEESNMKITISLQTNTVQVFDNQPIHIPVKSGTHSGSDAESKRASKRRRVPNRFYGYSSDEEYMLKPHLPPKLEWRKEDLPSPTGTQQCPSPPELPHISDIVPHQPEPVEFPQFPQEPASVSSDDSDSSKEGALQINFPPSQPMEQDTRVVGQFSGAARHTVGSFPFPRPAGARKAREGESVYCYCRCPYDEVSEMIACDGEGCTIEWFHFECVGIMVPPKGKWFCPDCRQRLENSSV